MTGVDWNRVLPLLGELLERPESEHEAFLKEACGDDPQLAATLRRLVAEDRADTSFLDSPLQAGEGREAQGVPSELKPGDEIGPWTTERLLGSGGMGEVWLARREDLGQVAAVKLVRSDSGSRDLLDRFDRERRILASFEHPNIARLIGGGALENGRPWLAMEYVAGLRIDEFCRTHRLDLRARVRLTIPVLKAVEAAHRQLIVHRDLKPSNVLVQEDGTPKLLDFGIAKAIEADDDATRTHPDRRPMTPRYASPEQLAGERASTQSDVYSLGVLLYELLTTVSPYGDTTSSMAVWKVVQDRTPTRPSSAIRELDAPERAEFGDDAAPGRLRRGLARELDWIVMTALRKEPARRYASVERFADDLSRFLEGRPVEAGPDSWRYRANKFIRRNWLATSAAIVATTALLLGTIATRIADMRARNAVQDERRAVDTAADTVTLLQHFMLAGTPAGGGGKGARSIDALRQARSSIDKLQTPIARCVAHSLLGAAFSSLGETAAAIEHLETAVELAEGQDERGKALARLYQLLAGQMEIVGRDDEGIPLMRRALSLLDRGESSKLDEVVGPEIGEPERFAILPRLALMLEDTGELEESREHYAQARSGLAAASGGTSADVLILNFNRACSDLVAGDFRGCVETFESFYENRDITPTEVQVGLSSGFGHVLCLMEQSERAEPVLRSGVALAQREFSAEHPILWDAELGLARALLLNDKFEECEQLALELRARPEGADGVDQEAQLTWVLGRCWTRMGRAEEAERLFAPLVAKAETVWGHDRAEHGLLRLAWCECLANLGREDEARVELERAFALFEEFDCRGCLFGEQAERLGRELGLNGR